MKRIIRKLISFSAAAENVFAKRAALACVDAAKSLRYRKEKLSASAAGIRISAGSVINPFPASPIKYV